MSSSATRMVRQVRNQGRGLFAVSTLLLLSCTTMTALYGWSLGSGLVDAAAFSVAFAMADIGGAYMMSFAGTCAAAKDLKGARKAGAFAFVCMGFTFIGLLGFQSNNREIQAAVRERASGIVDSWVNWSKDLALKEISKDKSKDKASLDKGVGIVGDAVKRQLEMLENGKVAPDGQATTIARMTGMTEAQARSWTIGLTSAILLIIQYSLWWAYGKNRQQLEPIISGIAHGPLGPKPSGKSGQLPDTVQRVEYEKAREDVAANIAAGIELCNQEYAARWRCDPTQVTKWSDKMVKEGICDYVRRGQRKYFIRSRKFRLLNGGLEPESA